MPNFVINGTEMKELIAAHENAKSAAEDAFVMKSYQGLMDAINEELTLWKDGSRLPQNRVIYVSYQFEYEHGYYNNDMRIHQLEKRVRELIDNNLICNDFVSTDFDVSYAGHYGDSTNLGYRYGSSVHFRIMSPEEMQERDNPTVITETKGRIERVIESFRSWLHS